MGPLTPIFIDAAVGVADKGVDMVFGPALKSQRSPGF